MTIRIKISKKPLENFQPSRYCQWCVKITADRPEEFQHSDDDLGVLPVQWALDFPADTDILDPEMADMIDGAPDYTIDPGPGEGTITQPGEKEVTICFVAACAEKAGTEMSLERRIEYPAGAVMAPRNWHAVPFKGAPTGKKPILGPAPVAMAPNQKSGEVGILASFEAQKLAALMGIEYRKIEALASKVNTKASAESVIYVSGKCAAAPRAQTKKQKKK
ncbi:MAG: hypothetical protein V3V10_03815 [Planctomycetota bacterium]